MRLERKFLHYGREQQSRALFKAAILPRGLFSIILSRRGVRSRFSILIKHFLKSVYVYKISIHVRGYGMIVFWYVRCLNFDKSIISSFSFVIKFLSEKSGRRSFPRRILRGDYANWKKLWTTNSMGQSAIEARGYSFSAKYRLAYSCFSWNKHENRKLPETKPRDC